MDVTRYNINENKYYVESVKRFLFVLYSHIFVVEI